ncbi:MAG: dihydropteroate synthase [Atopobiaceae bacterium]
MLRENYYDWQCGNHQISLARPRIMGILNVTPDSFSDGGQNYDPKVAVEHAIQMLDDGADIIDVGGESTRPGHKPVSPEEEMRRIVPVVRQLVQEGAVVSVDTRHAQTAKMCLHLGADIINDVTGFTDPDMVKVVAPSKCGLVVMHWNQTTGINSRKSVTLDSARPARAVMPTNRRFTLPEEAPIMREVMGFLGDQARTLMRAGVSHDRICIDPGPGFDKTADMDVVIQRNTQKLVSMGYPVLTAVSRKRFVGAVSGVGQAADRDPATIGIVLSAVVAGARVLRVHNVAQTAQAVNSFWAVGRKDSRRAFISLGSNVGDRIGYLARATKLIDSLPLTCVNAVSHAYETEPAYGIATPVANAVAEIHTELHPLVLMDKLLDIEDQLDRVRDPQKQGFGPRTIDCDLCWFEGEEHAGRKLKLPHPGLGERDYVLVPMEDLMSDPERFLAHDGVDVRPFEERVGHVMADLGPVAWQA